MSDWSEQITRDTGDLPNKVFIADADNDGDNDIVTVNADKTVSILLWKEIPLSGLVMKIKDQSFSEENFNITVLVHDENDIGIDDATVQALWNGVSVPVNDIENLGSGLFRMFLTPITVAPGDPPILLNITISADGYLDLYYELYLAVDPEVIDKEIHKKKTPAIPGYNIILLISLISVISGLIMKKRITK
ncbi:hypothetical protein ES703_109766 [subsurface metagenome]